MNTKTGEIAFFHEGEAPSNDWQPLHKLADKHCPLCKGEGKWLIKEPGKRGKFKFIACACTQPPPFPTTTE